MTDGDISSRDEAMSLAGVAPDGAHVRERPVRQIGKPSRKGRWHESFEAAKLAAAKAGFDEQGEPWMDALTTIEKGA